MRLSAIAVALAAFATAGAAGAAFTNPVTVKLEKPLERAANNIVAAGVVWSCEGDTCTANLDRRRPMPRDCGDVAREVGKVVSFTLAGQDLDQAGLETCNRRAR
jgi:hypothetical protein